MERGPDRWPLLVIFAPMYAAYKLEFHGTDTDTDTDIRDAPVV